MLSSLSAGKIEGEKYVGEAGTVAASYWTPQEFTEAAVAVNVYGVEGTLKGVLLLYNCVASPATVETGYYLGLVPSGVGTVKCEIGLAGVGKLAEANIAGMKEGDGIALDVKAGVVSAWHKSGAGEWELVCEVADSTYTEGHAVLAIYLSSNGAYTDFSVSSEKIKKLSASLSLSGKIVPHKEGGEGNINTLGMIL
jgi:hypothetical protein